MADFSLQGYPLVKISFGAAPAIVDDQRFFSILTGNQEVPPVNTRDFGTARYRLREEGTELRFRHRLRVRSEIVAAHLHLAPAGENGPIVAFLFDDTNRGERLSGSRGRTTLRGTLTTADLTGPLQGQPLDRLIAEIQSGNVYINIHTEENPAGQIRGQLYY